MILTFTVGSFPFFPAEVLNPEDADEDDPIPEYVFTNRAKIEKDNHGEGQKTWLVRFFDKSNSYGWMPATRMDLLASDDCLSLFHPVVKWLIAAIDAMYLAVCRFFPSFSSRVMWKGNVDHLG